MKSTGEGEKWGCCPLALGGRRGGVRRACLRRMRAACIIVGHKTSGLQQ